MSIAPSRPISALVLTGLLVLMGLTSLALTMVPYETWLGLANHYSTKGTAADIITPVFFANMVLKARVAAALFLLLGGTIFCWRKSISAELGGAVADVGPLLTGMKQHLAAITAEDGRSVWLWLALITLTGLALRLSLAGQPLRYDEALIFSAFAKLPVPFIVTNYTNVGNHVFHTLLLHWSWLLFGSSEIAIRLPVLVSGALIPPLVWLVARNGWGWTAGLTAAALAASSSALIEYSANSRGYMLLALLVLLQMLLAQTLARRDNRAAWALWPVVAALSFWTLPVAILSHGALVLWLLAAILARPRSERRQGVIRLIAACGLGAMLTLLLYSPILVVFGLGHMSVMTGTQSGPVALWAVLEQHSLDLWSVWTRNLPSPLSQIVAAAAALGAVLSHRGEQKASLSLCLLLWMGVLAVLFPIFGFSRLWLSHWVLAIVLVGIGLEGLVARLPSRRLARSAGLVLAGILLAVPAEQEIRHGYVRSVSDGAFFEAADAASWLGEQVQSGDLIYAPSPAAYPLYYAFTRQGRTVRLVNRMRIDSRPVVAGQLWQAFSLEGAPSANRPNRLYLVLTATSSSLNSHLVEIVAPGAQLPDAPVVARFGESVIHQVDLAPLLVAP